MTVTARIFMKIALAGQFFVKSTYNWFHLKFDKGLLADTRSRKEGRGVIFFTFYKAQQQQLPKFKTPLPIPSHSLFAPSVFASNIFT